MSTIQGPQKSQNPSWSAATATSLVSEDAAAGEARIVEKDGSYIGPAVSLADRVVRDFRDHYGPQHTPLFVDALDLETGRPFEYDRAFRDQAGGVLCNVGYQQNWLRTLVSLTSATGDPKYQEEAERALRFYMNSTAHPDSGLFPWGGHMYYNLSTRQIVGYQHELKAVYPLYELMWQIDPDATHRYIEGFFAAHVEDLETMNFNRHAQFTGELIRGRLTFLSTGSDLILAATFLYGKTGESRYRDWAWRIAKRYDDVRDPHTGLGAYQFVMSLHGSGTYTEIFGPDYNETNVEQYGYRFTYFDFILLYASTLMKDTEAAQDLRRWAVQDLKAYRTYGYDPETDGFYGMLCTRTGRHLTRSDFKDPNTTRLTQPNYYAKRGPWFLARLLRSYVYGYQLTKDNQLLDTACLIVRILDREAETMKFGAPVLQGPACNAESFEQPTFRLTDRGEAAASLIQALLDFYAATGDDLHLANAQSVADEAIESLSRHGVLMRSSNDKECWLNQRLPLALIRLQCVVSGVPAPVVADLGGTIRPTKVK